MKSFIVLTLLVSAFSAFAYSPLEDVTEDICKKMKLVNNETGICWGAKDVKTVLGAKVGNNLTTAEYSAIGFYTLGPIEMNIVPDADTNHIFSYTRWLVDASGKKVGILDINGWENYEMDARGRVDARYNLKGEVVWIAVKDI